MADDWIKMRPSLLTSPKVNGIARHLEEHSGVSKVLSTGFAGTMSEIVTRSVMRSVTVASLLVIWGAANEHTDDGVFRNADLLDIDDMVGIPGFGEAMISVGWLEFDAEEFVITLPNFNEYNTTGKERSATAKTNAERQKAFRDRQKHNESNVTSNVTNNVTSNRREEKRREEVNQKIESATSSQVVQASTSVCSRLVPLGFPSVSPSHPQLIALLEGGITEDEIIDAAAGASAAGKPFTWVLAKAEGRRRDAASVSVIPVASAIEKAPDVCVCCSAPARKKVGRDWFCAAHDQYSDREGISE